MWGVMKYYCSAFPLVACSKVNSDLFCLLLTTGFFRSNFCMIATWSEVVCLLSSFSSFFFFQCGQMCYLILWPFPIFNCTHDYWTRVVSWWMCVKCWRHWLTRQWYAWFLNTSCIILCQTEPPGSTAEPSGGRGNWCCADSRTSHPPLGAPASGPIEAQTAASSTAAETPPGMGQGGEGNAIPSSSTDTDSHNERLFRLKY